MGMTQVADALEALALYRSTHQMEFYDPYPFQKAFHHAKAETSTTAPFELSLGALAVQVALMCANQIGKTTCAAYEVAYHATGKYPDWWEGIRFAFAPNIVVAGKSNDSVRDIVQNELLGDPFDETKLGTGAIPLESIGKQTRKAGVPNALSAVMVKHISGKNSKIRFMAYEQGKDPFMGIRFDFGWLDEEPPLEIWTQFIRGTISRKQGEFKLSLTFTPEDGVTEVVDGFMNNLKSGQALVTATWDDAPHMTKARQEEILSQLPPHERQMRSMGIPTMGSGLIFPVPDETLMCEPFDIPNHWPRICGIDFGWDHPFAAIWMAHDRESDTVYIYDMYKERQVSPPIHASAIRHRGDWIPVAWPHDGLKTDPKSGATLAQQYRDEGLNLLQEKFSNPPAPGQKEGQGGNGVEAGLFDMLTRMEQGRLKVFSNLDKWFEEKRQYHRKLVNGKATIVDRKDDAMAATRYADMSLRFASTRPQPRVVRSTAEGLTNW